MSDSFKNKAQISDHFKYHALLRCENNFKYSLELSKYFSRYFDKVKRIADEPLNLAVMGEFSVGKSSFINKLLDIDILPVGITPITSVVTTLKYGKDEKAEVHYSSENDDKKNIVREISYSVLNDYQKASEIDNEVYRREVESIKEIVIYLDNENLKKFNIIDTPGFNHSKACDEITKKLFDRLDFVVWLFDASQAGKLTESVLLDELLEKVNNIYAVINKIDIVDSSDIKQTARELNLKIAKIYGKKFTNTETIPCISLKILKNEFGEYFTQFLKDFNNSVIDRDYHISKKEIEFIYDDIQSELEQIQRNLSEFENKINKELTGFINYCQTQEYKKQADDLSKATYDIILSTINDVFLEISESQIYNSLPVQNPTLKFYCLYRTFEKIEELKKTIGEIYLKYLNFYKEKFLGLDTNIRELIGEITHLYPDELGKQMEETLSYNRSIINGFIAKRYKLSTIGYIFGLLSDNFIYEKFILKDTRKIGGISNKSTQHIDSDKKKTILAFATNSFLNSFPGKGKSAAPPDVLKNEEKFKIIANELNREIIVQLFKIDLETIEVENKLSELKEKMNIFIENLAEQIKEISKEMQVVK